MLQPRGVDDKVKALVVALVLGGCVAGNGSMSQTRKGMWESTESTSNLKELREMKLGNRQLTVEVVATPEEVERGLGYRDEIGSEGMLFVMPQRRIYSFWMKGMRIGLDMVWIDCGGGASDQTTNQEYPGTKRSIEETSLGGDECVVADVTERVPAPEDPEDYASLGVYQPRVPVTHVLEVSYGKVEEWGVGIGEKVEM